MRRIRRHITVEEANQIPDIKAFESLWWNPDIGDLFVVRGSEEVHSFCTDSYRMKDNKDGYYIYYQNKEGILESVRYENCLPIFNIPDLIDFLEVEGNVQIQSLRNSWFVVTEKPFVGDENEELVSVLWKAVLDQVSNRA